MVRQNCRFDPDWELFKKRVVIEYISITTRFLTITTLFQRLHLNV